jgi:hypothetical protein
MHIWQGHHPFITLHLEGTRVHYSPCCRFLEGLEGLYHVQGYYVTAHNTASINNMLHVLYYSILFDGMRKTQVALYGNSLSYFSREFATFA